MGKEIVIPNKVMASALVHVIVFLFKVMTGKLKNGKEGLEALEDLVKKIITEWEEAKDATENKQG